MLTSISLLIQSYLSDAMIDISNNQENIAYNRIKITKYLVSLLSQGQTKISDQDIAKAWVKLQLDDTNR
jgi:hypothetical protein